MLLWFVSKSLCGQGISGNALFVSLMGGPSIAYRARAEAECQRRCPPQRWSSTPTCAHIASNGHVEHFGRVPVQTCLPNGTSNALISTQYRRGSFSCSAAIVFSGVFVAT